MSRHKPNRPKNNPGTDPHKKSSEKETTNRHVYIEPGAQIDFVQDLKQKYESSQGNASTHNKKQLFWTQVGAGLIFIYALITFWQGCLTREAIGNNSEQFQIDQRPYLWTANKRPRTTIKVGLRMLASFELVDYGKSPAVKVAGTGKIFFGPTAKAQADQWFASLGQKPLQPVGQNEIVVPPGIPSVFPVPNSNSNDSGQFPVGEEAEKVANAIPEGGFGGGGYFTLMTDTILTQKDVDFILNMEESIAIVARFQYYDGFNNRYWSDICLSRFTVGSMPNCERHNEMH